MPCETTTVLYFGQSCSVLKFSGIFSVRPVCWMKRFYSQCCSAWLWPSLDHAFICNLSTATGVCSAFINPLDHMDMQFCYAVTHSDIVFCIHYEYIKTLNHDILWYIVVLPWPQTLLILKYENKHKKCDIIILKKEVFLFQN